MRTVLFLLVLLSFAYGEAGHSKIFCGRISIKCNCGTGENGIDSITDVDIYLIQADTTGKMECNGMPNLTQLCVNYCYSRGNFQQQGMENGNKEMQLPSFLPLLYPKVFIIKPGEENGNKEMQLHSFLPLLYPKVFIFKPGEEVHDTLRYARDIMSTTPDLGVCYVKPQKYGYVKCWKWPHWIHCNINCIYGADLQGIGYTGKSVQVECNTTENEWKPSGFPDCEIHVYCKTHLTDLGNLKCYEPLDGPPYCNIYCYAYDDFEEVPLQRYECIDDNYASSLPRCAALGEATKPTEETTTEMEYI